MNICGLPFGENRPYFKGQAEDVCFVDMSTSIVDMSTSIESSEVRVVCDNEELCKFITRRMTGDKDEKHKI